MEGQPAGVGGPDVIGAECLPASDNPEKSENLVSVGTQQGFSPFLTYSESGSVENTPAAGPTDRGLRRAAEPHGWQVPSAALPGLSGVPRAWRDGVAMLAERTAPHGVTMTRWRVFRWNAGRVLADHGAALHDAGWGGLDLFGLYAAAPVTNPSGWGVAWLLERGGAVLDVERDGIGIRREPGGSRLVFRTRAIRVGVVLAWEL